MQVLDRANTDREDLRQMTDVQLERLGVRVLDRKDTRLQCITCGLSWRPETDWAGHLPFGYWVCPARCNE